MTTIPAITSQRPINPIELPTGNRTQDKFDKLFRKLFEAGEFISIDAEETLAGLLESPNQQWDNVWYTEASPYLIRAGVYKTEDGSPAIDVNLSKKKPGKGVQFTNFTRYELDLLSQYKIGVFDHNLQKASHLVSIQRDKDNPRFEIPLSSCTQELDSSITLPAHREPNKEFTPHSFSIFVVKKEQ